MLPAHKSKVFALRYLGNLAKDAIVDWALAELEVGHDSESLRILAGMRDHPYPTEVEVYFFRALQELKIDAPDKATALSTYCGHVAEGILNDSISTSNGVTEITWVCYRLGYPRELSNWIFLAEDLDPKTYGELTQQTFDIAVKGMAKQLLMHSPLFSPQRILELKI